ncbi:MAG: thiamine biosynthesis protein ThiS [Omnitrophica WOR_2 bacterium RIFCSPHIGHO2_02_FULL_68_15]|nr:MAG: thiamine biosynthesis protein ThiS [Omnitrophica WOR_2 bacterium RIFCSPHIGHO2_02_FULL_68_15]
MQVIVNGEQRELPEGTTALQMLETLKVQPERVVVELNLTILKRAQLPGAVLKEGDRVEIIHFVGGGSPQAVLTDTPRMR